MKILFSTILTLCLSSVALAAEESVFEAGTVAECRANVAAMLVIKQSEGWDCSISANTGTCTKDGVRAVFYCDGSKAVISMHKN